MKEEYLDEQVLFIDGMFIDDYWLMDDEFYNKNI